MADPFIHSFIHACMCTRAHTHTCIQHTVTRHLFHARHLLGTRGSMKNKAQPLPSRSLWSRPTEKLLWGGQGNSVAGWVKEPPSTPSSWCVGRTVLVWSLSGGHPVSEIPIVPFFFFFPSLQEGALFYSGSSITRDLFSVTE